MSHNGTMDMTGGRFTLGLYADASGPDGMCNDQTFACISPPTQFLHYTRTHTRTYTRTRIGRSTGAAAKAARSETEARPAKARANAICAANRVSKYAHLLTVSSNFIIFI